VPPGVLELSRRLGSLHPLAGHIEPPSDALGAAAAAAAACCASDSSLKLLQAEESTAEFRVGHAAECAAGDAGECAEECVDACDDECAVKHAVESAPEVVAVAADGVAPHFELRYEPATVVDAPAVCPGGQRLFWCGPEFWTKAAAPPPAVSAAVCVCTLYCSCPRQGCSAGLSGGRRWREGCVP